MMGAFFSADTTFVDTMAEGQMPLFDSQNVREGLAGSGIACPPLDGELLRTFAEHGATDDETRFKRSA